MASDDSDLKPNSDSSEKFYIIGFAYSKDFTQNEQISCLQFVFACPFVCSALSHNFWFLWPLGQMSGISFSIIKTEWKQNWSDNWTTEELWGSFDMEHQL